jgi:2'-phosphotransferase
MQEGVESEEFLLRIIDPNGTLSQEAQNLATPSSTAPRRGGRWKSSDATASNGRPEDSLADPTNGGYGMSHLENVSRKLSLVLRHDTKIAVRSDGFCKLSEVLALRRFRDIDCTIEDINQVVAGAQESGNSKQRFQVKEEEGEKWIRANQGYSRKDILAENAYRRLELDDPDNPLPQPCVHGTYHWHWASILQQGLLAGGLAGRQGRNEIHFACEEPGGPRRAISGMRHDCDVAIWLDLKAAIEEGFPFYISDNGVILSPGDDNGSIPSRFFQRAVDLRYKPPRQLWPLQIE